MQTLTIEPRTTVHTTSDPRPQFGTSRRWARTINGKRFSFTVVNMPDGELRLVVSQYNGYGDDGTAEGRLIGMRFACAWDQVKFITIKPEPKKEAGMNIEDAREHAEHLCDVWPIAEDVEHIGVINEIDERGEFPMILVGGHPEYPARWFRMSDLETNCKLVTHYRR